MKRLQVFLFLSVGLMACEGGVFKKKNCKTCETLTYNAQNTQPSRIENRVCGDEVDAYITSNNITTSSLTVVTTCK
ncbi:hypothetical protein [Spirosoma terrae]|uniref:Lipoprotein n=1 Tax=Spirosoma terrae TaxID=1968276 RepID=A0A6L9L8T5_9BACT|nr:hypothetical protein [Spirosoma terrae]NDU95183.1 hypothetical protein [Spirosoma terrae]